MRGCGTRIRNSVKVLFLTATLLMCSGCVSLLLLGAGAAGGYLIKKGEEESPKSKGHSHSTGYSSKNKVG